VSEFNPAGFTSPATRSFADSPADEIDDIDSEPKTAREGLPASYRMRADAHYVDQLTSRSPEEKGRKSMAATPAAAPERRTGLIDDVLALLADQSDAIESAAARAGGERSPLARRAAWDLVRAEAWRASWMLRATALVEARHAYRARQKPLGPVVSAVREKLVPELRLAGAQLHIVTNDWNATAEVDEAAFVTGVTGAVFATLGLIDDPVGVSLRVTIKSASGELLSIEVAQDDVTVPDAVLEGFWDVTATGLAGRGLLPALGAAAARAYATLSGGQATIAAGRRGSVLRLEFERPF
jgi:hypothetical protein